MAKNAVSLKNELVAFKRERIVAAAALLFYDQGYEATTVDAIAAHLRTTKQFIYAYFDSKTDLLFEVCRNGSVHALDAAQRAAAIDADAETRLRALVGGFTRVVCQDKVSVGVFIREEKNLSEAQNSDIAARRRAFDAILLSILEDGVAAGAFDVTDGHATTRLMSGMVNFIFSWFKPGRQLSVDSLADIAADLAVRMVRRV